MSITPPQPPADSSSEGQDDLNSEEFYDLPGLSGESKHGISLEDGPGEEQTLESVAASLASWEKARAEKEVDQGLAGVGQGLAQESSSGREKPPCYNKAMDLLSRRPHFEAELRIKLRKRLYDQEEIESAFVRLRENRFLNDEETAQIFVKGRLRRGGLGRRKLAADLAKRGAPSGAIDTALEAISLDVEIEGARSAADRWGRRSRSDKTSLRDALGRHLDRKGFSKRVILVVLDEWQSRASDPA